MTAVDQVLRLHALGLSVIPLKPHSKRPDADVLPKDENGEATWTPYKTERATETEIRRWFNNGVNRNVGIVTGKVSTVVVVESDTPEAEAWCEEHLPPTPMMTRSARGRHRFYHRPMALPEIPASIKTPNGLTIEIKRDGQYVVGPGSVHP